MVKLVLEMFSFNPLTPTVKYSFITFDSMYRTLKHDHSLESCGAVLYCGFCFNFSHFVILGKLSVLGLALSGVKGLKSKNPGVMPSFEVTISRLYFIVRRGSEELL